MFKHRKIIMMILSTLICISLTACQTDESEYENEYMTEVAYEDNEPLQADDYHDYITAQIVFSGAPVRADELHWTTERDRAWEEDVRTFAIIALRSHPLLHSYDIVFFRGRAHREHSYEAFNVLLQRAAARNGILADNAYDMTNELRELIIQKVNALILEIPDLNDYAIKFILQEIAAVFGDAHTMVYPNIGRVFPIQVFALRDGIYITGAPHEMEHILYGEILAIGGTSIYEITERFLRIISHENEYGFRHMSLAADVVAQELLHHIGVIDDSGMADFTIRDVSGEIFDITLQAVGRDVFDDMITAEFVSHELGFLTHRHLEEEYWFFYEYFSDESLMYIRISRFSESASVNAVIRELRNELSNWQNDDIAKLVIDLRQNRGGRHTWPLGGDFSIINELANYVYVIIDGSSYSASIVAATYIMNYAQNVTIIGEPTAGPKNFFSGSNRFLPNSNLWYRISEGGDIYSDCSDVAIRPDILIHLTIDNIINRRDPVLDFIRDQ